LGDRDPSEDLPGLLSKWEESRDCVADRCEARLRRSTAYSDGSRFVANLFSTKVVRSLDGLEQELIIEAIRQRETLHAAEQRTLELIADGASLKEVLDQLCSSMDVQVAPSVTTVY